MYTYPAMVVRVIDGDTIVLDVDLGFDTWVRHQHFRLRGVNARERSDLGGKEARDNLAALLVGAGTVTIKSVKPDKFGGRYDAEITLSDGTDLCTKLVTSGWAARWNGRGERPVPPWPRQLE